MSELTHAIRNRLRGFANAYLRLPHESNWKYDTSAGADLSISIPETKIGVVISGGAFYLKKDGEAASHTLRYGAAGASIGLQLVPLPFNFDLALKEMPSNGTVYTGPLTGAELTLDEFYGPCLIYQGGGQVGPGYNVGVIFMGGSRFAFLASMSNPAVIVLTCRAIVTFRGMNVNLLPFGFGASGAVGEVF